MTFYDINYWNVAECLFDIFSIIFFIWILSVVLIIGFSKFTTFQAAKPLYYFTGFCVNVMITLVFTIYYAIIFNLIKDFPICRTIQTQEIIDSSLDDLSDA